MGIDSSPVSWATRAYREIQEIGESDGSVLIAPFGSTEQHGPHLPVATDTILATAIADGGARTVHEEVPVLVLPPFWAGVSPHHFSLGGTLSSTFETLLQLFQEVLDSALQNEFDAVLVVNGHGGNAPLIGAIVTAVGHDHPDIQVLGLSYFDLAAPFVDDIRDSETGGMSHAGEFETSLLLHLEPQLVEESAFAATYRDEPHEHAKQDMFDTGPLSVYRSFDEYTDTGVIGDPTLASAEKGEALYDGLVTEIGEIIRSIHEAALQE
jgi:creatinine amidohydrolase